MEDIDDDMALLKLSRRPTKKLISTPVARRQSVFQTMKAFNKLDSSSITLEQKTPSKDITPTGTDKVYLMPSPVADQPSIKEFEDSQSEEASEEGSDYNESDVFHTTEIEEEIINQGVLSVVSQYGTTRSSFIIEPDSSYKMTWDILNFLLILYQCIVVPYRI